VGNLYGTYIMSRYWGLEFWSGSYVFGKFVHSYNNRQANKIFHIAYATPRKSLRQKAIETRPYFEYKPQRLHRDFFPSYGRIFFHFANCRDENSNLDTAGLRNFRGSGCLKRYFKVLPILWGQSDETISYNGQ
jgi:hypothetical protein